MSFEPLATIMEIIKDRGKQFEHAAGVLFRDVRLDGTITAEMPDKARELELIFHERAPSLEGPLKVLVWLLGRCLDKKHVDIDTRTGAQEQATVLRDLLLEECRRRARAARNCFYAIVLSATVLAIWGVLFAGKKLADRPDPTPSPTQVSTPRGVSTPTVDNVHFNANARAGPFRATVRR